MNFGEFCPNAFSTPDFLHRIRRLRARHQRDWCRTLKARCATNPTRRYQLVVIILVGWKHHATSRRCHDIGFCIVKGAFGAQKTRGRCGQFCLQVLLDRMTRRLSRYFLCMCHGAQQLWQLISAPHARRSAASSTYPRGGSTV